MEVRCMRASERRLLGVFLALGGLIGTVLVVQQIRGWQHRLDRRERDVELAQMESRTLLAEAPMWMAKEEWLTQVQPAAESELQANEGLLEQLRNTATGVGLEISKTQIEATQQTDHYRQFGVSLLLKGDLPLLMRWVHGLLGPDTFYVMPQLRISPDKEDPTKVTALVRVWRWYRADLSPAKDVGA
jgi:hypothetical protein